MRKFYEDNKNTFFSMYQALLIFFVLFVLLVSTALFYDFSDTSLGDLAFILAIACLVLISKNVYDLSKGEERDKKVIEKIRRDVITHPSQKLFSVVYDNSPIAYLIIDSKGLIISANKAAVRMLGKTASRLNKTDFFSYLGNEKNEHTVLFKEKFFNGVIIADEEIQLKKAGNDIWATLSVMQFNDSIRKNYSLVTLVDITKQKEIDIAKSEFVSLASHQLRTPIAGMRWSAELLLMDEGDPLSKQQKRYVERLLSNIKRMGDLISDFLQVSRFDLGTRTAELKIVNVEQLLEQVVVDHSAMVEDKNLTIEKYYDGELQTMVTDEKLLRVIMTNIYNNAIKYSYSGGKINLSYYKKDDEVFFSVQDRGMAIPIAEQGKVFSKVFRASNAIREVPDGTGLGLYIAKKAAEVLRGRITFVSTKGIGTTFTVVIPIVNKR